MDSISKIKAFRYSPAQWETQKPNIERLYILEAKPLKEVIQVLAQEIVFQASEKQLKSRLTKWGFDVKNLKGDTMVQLARIKAKRRLEKKESSFRVTKKPVDDQKIERYIRRHEITEDDLLAMASPQCAPSPSCSVFTPRESVRSPTPDNYILSASTDSPMRGLKFQSLSIIDEQPEKPEPSGKMIIEESSFDCDLLSQPAPLLESQFHFIVSEPPSDLLFENAMNEDSPDPKSGVERIETGSHATTIWESDPSFLNSVREEQQSSFRLWSTHMQAIDNQEKEDEEQKNSPPSPADIPASDLQEREQCIAEFRDAVMVRYVEKAVDRARIRMFFAPNEHP